MALMLAIVAATAVAIVGLCCALLLRRRRRRAMRGRVRQVKVPFEPFYPALGLDQYSELTLNGEDVYVREAYAAAARWRREQEALDQAQRAAIAPIQQKLRRAQRLVAESGVGGAACDLLQIMWHWPARAKHADWKLPVAIAALEGSEAGAGKAKWIAWTRNGLRFRLQLDAGSNDNGAAARLGELRLAVDGEEVLRLDVAQGVGDDHDRWRVSGVSAFRAGPWMMQLNELAGELRIASSQTVREHVLQFYGEKARNIVL